MGKSLENMETKTPNKIYKWRFLARQIIELMEGNFPAMELMTPVTPGTPHIFLIEQGGNNGWT
jgi:hypothetical protein